MSTNTKEATAQVDVRGPRFVAWVTTVVIVATLLVSTISNAGAAVVLGLQAVVFAIGAWRGPRHHPYGLIFQRLVAPRLGPVTEREPVPPLKFAQLVGFIFAVAGTHRVRRRHPAARPGRHRIRTCGGVPQCGLRHLPWLPALSVRRTVSPCAHNRLKLQNPSNRKDPLHGTLRRPGLDGLGREQSRRAEHRLRRGRRGQLRPMKAATSRAPSGWTGRPSCRIR